eukprot:CAMPEP_0205929118 /NCGR_PEP_ID=MMETSP1325-20131115/25126_1 /ASSEMBLY_ACC=CAM_ASM_000708 /TAXON_ID=236786 /ORGANISM="Florenciella sp., Strain RCC1007" /LENGTH=79 /DNA_ID=CAMNT_0053298283 /DNA_START=23 /DNA_END=259 /DNA_ORIENTATION=+
MFRAMLITAKTNAPGSAPPIRSIGSGLNSVFNGCAGASTVKHGPGVVKPIPLTGPALAEITEIPPAYVAKGIIRSTVVH